MAAIENNAQTIKTLVDSGKRVFCGNKNYEVIKDSKNQYLIKSGSHYIGLTWMDETTLNGNNFFTEE